MLDAAIHLFFGIISIAGLACLAVLALSGLIWLVAAVRDAYDEDNPR